MSWHYLQALVGESSGGTCSDGEPSAPWKRSRTVERCSYEGSETVCFPCSQSGTTATRSTDDHGVDSWMLSLRDSPVSRSPLEESKTQSKTAGTDGPQPFAFLERSNQGLPYWKTSQGCFPGLMATLGEYSEAWPRSGTMQSGTVCQLRPSVPLTGVIACGCLPTPVASDADKMPKKSLSVVIEKSENRGKLNPMWVAWLMGWPIGWTDLEPLEMDRWLQWCHSHGIHS